MRFYNILPNGAGARTEGTIIVDGQTHPRVVGFNPAPDAVGYQSTFAPMVGGTALTVQWFNDQTTLPATFDGDGIPLIGAT